MTTSPEDRLIFAANDVLADTAGIELTSQMLEVRIGIGANPEPGEYLDLYRDGNGKWSIAAHTKGIDTHPPDQFGNRVSRPLEYNAAVANAVDILRRRIGRARLLGVVDQVSPLLRETDDVVDAEIVHASFSEPGA